MKIGVICAAIVCYAAVFVNGFGSRCPSNANKLPKRFPEPTVMPKNFKVAFLGDSGDGTEQRAVLNMVKSWGAQVVIHSGDFDYEDDPANFESCINSVLGANFPYFASIGNHDEEEWEGSGGYQARLIDRLERIGATDNCTGDYGVNMACNWNGLFFVLSGPGTWGSGHANYIDETFSTYPAIWKFVSWHKNQRLMQIGGKSDETGWTVYDTTRENGAIVVTGHEHSYCRSYMMSNFQRQTVANRNATLNLKPGESFVFVSGLGGESIREWDEDLVENPWWAAVAADDNGVSDGALLCTFNTVNERTAECTFRDRNGRTWDSFVVYSQNPSTMEEHQEAMRLKEENRKKSYMTEDGKCEKPAFVEVTVKNAGDDVFENEKGELQCHTKVISLAHGAAALRFENVPISKGTKVQHAYLQVYGEVTDDVLPHYVITASSKTKLTESSAEGLSLASTLACGAETEGQIRKLNRSFLGRTAKSQVVWEKEDEGWERHTVWVSPDLKDLVNELISHPDWSVNDDIVLQLTGKGNRAFYSADKNACFAPTLALEFVQDC